MFCKEKVNVCERFKIILKEKHIYEFFKRFKTMRRKYDKDIFLNVAIEY